MNSFEFNGVAFTVRHIDDDSIGAPWEQCDGHGPVRQVRDGNSKRAGERVLYKCNRGGAWLYDWQKATEIAKRDRWGAKRPGLSPAQRAAAAVQQDFEFLRGWLNDEWRYIGIVVEHAASGCTESLWGIESNAGEYLTQMRDELAGDIIDSARFKRYLRTPAVIDMLREAASIPSDRFDSYSQTHFVALQRAMHDAADILESHK